MVEMEMNRAMCYVGIPFGTPGKCSSVTIGIIFGNLSHQCAQIVGGTADLFGLVRQVIDISHHDRAPRARLALKSRIVLSFLIQKEGKREEKEMIDFPDPARRAGGPGLPSCQASDCACMSRNRGQIRSVIHVYLCGFHILS